MKKLVVCVAFIALAGIFTTSNAQDCKTKKCTKTEQCEKRCDKADCKNAECAKANCKECKCCAKSDCKKKDCKKSNCKKTKCPDKK